MSEPKYKNWYELIKAFESGELDKSKYKIMVDNDSWYLICIDDTDTDMDCENLYNSDSPLMFTIDMLRAIGIQAEGV